MQCGCAPRHFSPIRPDTGRKTCSFPCARFCYATAVAYQPPAFGDTSAAATLHLPRKAENGIFGLTEIPKVPKTKQAAPSDTKIVTSDFNGNQGSSPLHPGASGHSPRAHRLTLLVSCLREPTILVCAPNWSLCGLALGGRIRPAGISYTADALFQPQVGVWGCQDATSRSLGWAPGTSALTLEPISAVRVGSQFRYVPF